MFVNFSNETLAPVPHEIIEIVAAGPNHRGHDDWESLKTGLLWGGFYMKINFSFWFSGAGASSVYVETPSRSRPEGVF